MHCRPRPPLFGAIEVADGHRELPGGHADRLSSVARDAARLGFDRRRGPPAHGSPVSLGHSAPTCAARLLARATIVFRGSTSSSVFRDRRPSPPFTKCSTGSRSTTCRHRPSRDLHPPRGAVFFSRPVGRNANRTVTSKNVKWSWDRRPSGPAARSTSRPLCGRGGHALPPSTAATRLSRTAAEPSREQGERGKHP